MNLLFSSLWPEFVLTAAACVLFILGAVHTVSARKLVPLIALLALVGTFIGLLVSTQVDAAGQSSGSSAVFVDSLSNYIKLLTSAVAILFVLLSWPTNAQATGNAALDVGSEVGEFFGLMLLALTGIFLVASANDIMLLFLGIELASIPTYIMVSISRPLPVAQEAGVKYFFLGAMAAALMLFGFSYLYGTTGSTNLVEIRQNFHPGLGSGDSVWQLLAVVLVILGFSFKLAAVPLHEYAGDVYQGAATPVTALLAYVPKTSGIVALIKILTVVAGPTWTTAPALIVKLLFVMAVLTMTFGNALGLMQSNIKRVMAYSSVAHSGYMLATLTALLAAGAGSGGAEVRSQALAAVLFYLCAYGIMNTGAFGVLMLLPGRTEAHGRHDTEGNPLPTAGTAETFEDIAGLGRTHNVLGLAMAVCCFSLTGLPLTIGFMGKIFLIRPAYMIWNTGGNPFGHLMIWLVVLTMLNAAVSAGYYLKIVAYLFLRPETVDPTRPASAPAPTASALPAALVPCCSWAVSTAVALSVAGTLYYGTFLPATSRLAKRVQSSAAASLAIPAAPVGACEHCSPALAAAH